jgi:hypothetical protein
LVPSQLVPVIKKLAHTPSGFQKDISVYFAHEDAGLIRSPPEYLIPGRREAMPDGEEGLSLWITELKKLLGKDTVERMDFRRQEAFIREGNVEEMGYIELGEKDFYHDLKVQKKPALKKGRVAELARGRT